MAAKNGERSNDATAVHAFPPPVTYGSVDDWFASVNRHGSDSQRDDTSRAIGDLFSLDRGDRVDDFVIDRVLGRGAFGVVYLAHQVSLGRPVALKVMQDSGAGAEAEGRSLAQLEHPNIVNVYSESVDLKARVRLLCMQYVSGTTLLHLANELTRAEGHRDGAAFVDVLDRLDLPQTLFDPDAARDRDVLQNADACDLVCLVGEQLAEALAHAHDRGVLHRDIKPANILVSRYGRPLLADFNLASRPDEQTPAAIGGTLLYMSPEHLEAFRPDTALAPETVDERSDLYSLGVVLWELATGSSPFPKPDRIITRENLSDVLHDMAQTRDQLDRTASYEAEFEGDPALGRVIARCLSADPARRPQSGLDLAEMLAGVRQSRQTLRAAPLDPLVQLTTKFPIASLVVAAILPQIGASILQIAYNATRVIGDLTTDQQTIFPRLVVIFNVVVYPIALSWIGRRAWVVIREYRALRSNVPANQKYGVDPERVARIRQRSLKLPFELALVACLGWFPGAIVFPLALGLAGTSVSSGIWVHFAISFLLSGALAATYSCFATIGVIVRAMYPRFWIDHRRFHERAGQELSKLPAKIRLLTMLTSLVPLTGVTALVLNAPDKMDASYRALIISLIAFGAFGATAIGHLARRYIEQVYACRGTFDDASRPRVERTQPHTTEPLPSMIVGDEPFASTVRRSE